MPLRPLINSNQTTKVTQLATTLSAKNNQSKSVEANTANHNPTKPEPFVQLRPKSTIINNQTLQQDSNSNLNNSRSKVQSLMPQVELKRNDCVRKSVRKFATRTTKFRHLKGKILGKETHVTNLPTLCRTVPGECNLFKANRKFGAVPIGNFANQLAVIKLTTGRRLERGQVPSLICGNATIGDFAFDPFNDHRIAIGCNDAAIKVWTLPDNGLNESMEEPDFKMIGHNDRVTILEFHPLAMDILASASVDLTVMIWDLKSREPKVTLSGFEGPIFGIAWHPEGRQLATFSKDHKIRVFDAREATCLQEAQGPIGSRGGRLCWTNHGSQLCVVGFSRVSERQVILYSGDDITNELATESIDVNPAILVPYYDEGSSTLFLTGKGDTIVFAYEISPTNDGSPYIHGLSHFPCPAPHQAVSFLPKVACDIGQVEFAKCYRLTNALSIEPVSFTVPRVRSEYFQDDLFPKQRVTWEHALTGAQWLSGKDVQAVFVDLKPTGMDKLSEAPPVPSTPKRPPSSVSHSGNMTNFEGRANLESSFSVLTVGKCQQERLVNSISGNISINRKLEQKSFEGVDDNEWDESE